VKPRSTVRIHRQFTSDVRDQLEWLRQNDHEDWIEQLREDVTAARELLARFPGVGTGEGIREGRALRRLILRRVPFVAWFVVDIDAKVVTLLRLFHARQDRSRS
jgi:plasmid stabilization system protein ParE